MKCGDLLVILHLHLLNGFVPIIFNFSGSTISCKDLHPENAESPIAVTLAGMDISCKE